jgi:hypothetical protein
MPPLYRAHQKCRRPRPRGSATHIDDLRYERQGADIAAIASRIAALRDDHIDAALGSVHCLRNRRDLQHHARADIMGLPHQIARIAEREGDHCRPSRQRLAKHLGVQRLRNVIDCIRFVRETSRRLNAGITPSRIARQFGISQSSRPTS